MLCFVVCLTESPEMDILNHHSRIHIPLPILGDSSEELRHHECLQRIMYAHRLYLCRRDSEDADRLYRAYLRIHAGWLAEQRTMEQLQNRGGIVDDDEDDDEGSYSDRWPRRGFSPAVRSSGWSRKVVLTPPCRTRPSPARYQASSLLTLPRDLQAPARFRCPPPPSPAQNLPSVT